MKTVTDDMVIERCDLEASHAAGKAKQLADAGRAEQAVLFDAAKAFWSDLAFYVMAGVPLSREQAFVANYLRKDMSDNPRLWHQVTKRGKRKAAV